ncbi:hypothetical protein [Aquabacter sediminis]|uniref:hypothetical protein n=1 Tax=Aquabacter sediminis TaxID=3029197 RepID=UPI00237D69CF|nr:hypothetical protein [Aquabacter sp. P-9]
MLTDMVNRASIMRRAWSLFRQSMASYSRAAFAACLRQAWYEAKNAPVTPISAIRTVMGCSEGITRDELIERLEVALRAARAKAALYRRAGRPTNWSAAKYRSADICRVGQLEYILKREIAARDGKPLPT